jgi:hypothetical protein
MTNIVRENHAIMTHLLDENALKDNGMNIALSLSLSLSLWRDERYFLKKRNPRPARGFFFGLATSRTNSSPQSELSQSGQSG